MGNRNTRRGRRTRERVLIASRRQRSFVVTSVRQVLPHVWPPVLRIIDRFDRLMAARVQGDLCEHLPHPVFSPTHGLDRDLGDRDPCAAAALAVAAGPSDDNFSALAFCGDKSGAPAKHHVPLSYPHCALCYGFAYSLVPGQSGFLLAPVLADASVDHRWLSSRLARRPQLRSTALPRGPPTEA